MAGGTTAGAPEHEMEVKDVLLEKLQALKEDDFKAFKWNLETCTEIPASKLEKADMMDTVDLLVQYFPEEALDKTIACLNKIKRSDLVQRLSQTNTGGFKRKNLSDLDSSDEKPKVTADQPQSSRPVQHIIQTVAASKEQSGMSPAALKKALAASGYDVDKNKASLKTSLKRLVDNGTLFQTKETGAFKINKKADTKAKKPAKKAAPKAEKTVTKKPAAAKKSEKVAAKKTAATKKSKKPAEAKRPKKTAATKKSKVKTPAVKKAAKCQKKPIKIPKKVAKKASAAKKAPAKKVTKTKAKKAAPKKK